MFKVGDTIRYNLPNDPYWKESNYRILNINGIFYLTERITDKQKYTWSKRDLKNILNAELVKTNYRNHLPKWW